MVYEKYFLVQKLTRNDSVNLAISNILFIYILFTTLDRVTARVLNFKFCVARGLGLGDTM